MVSEEDVCYDVEYWPLWMFQGMPEAAVKPIDTYYFFWLGSVCGALGQIEPGDKRRRYLEAAGSGHGHLRNLLFASRDAPSVLSSAWDEAAGLKRLYDAVARVEAEFISDEEARLVRTAYRAFSTALRQVLIQNPAFHPEQVGIYNTWMLVEKADESIPKEIRDRVPGKAREDWKLAGRALAFGLSSACGFHTVRATETLIHQYYVTVTGDSHMKRKDRNWGAYVRNLKRHKKLNADSKVDDKLVALIDQIREHHRNVVIHPEESLDSSQAMVLFNVCLSAIISFVQEIFALQESEKNPNSLLLKLIKPELGPSGNGP